MYSRIIPIFVVLYISHDEGLEIILSSSSCLRLEPFVVSYRCVKEEGKDISGMQHGTIVDLPYIRYLFTREQFCSLNGEDIRNMTG